MRLDENSERKNFMDISNLDDMPEQLIALIKENIWV